MDFDIEITVDDILRGQGADPEKISVRKPILIQIAESAREMGADLIRQQVTTSNFRREDLFNGQLLARDLSVRSLEILDRKLEGAVEFTLAVCTIGDGLEKLSNQIAGEDFALALALDGMANAAIDQLVKSVFLKISNEAAAKDFGVSFPISPGSDFWPLEIGQPFIFGILEPDPSILRLNQNFLMLPKKSASFVVGIGPCMEHHGKTCDFCNLSANCRYSIRKLF